MFIDTEPYPKTKAPEERTVVGDYSPQQHSAPPELGTPSMESDHKHSVPLGLVAGPATLLKNRADVAVNLR